MRRSFIFLWLYSTVVFSQHLSVRNYTSADGLPDNTIFDVFQDRDQAIWLATMNGVSRYDGYEFVNYSTSDGIPDSRAWCVFQDDRGNILVGTRNGVCYKSPNGPAFQRYHHALDNANIYDIGRDRHGTLWFLGTNAVYRSLNDSIVPVYDTTVGFREGSYHHALEDRQGRIWFATIGGLYCWDGTSAKRYTVRDGLHSESLRGLFLDPDDRLWILSLQHGILIWDLKTGKKTHPAELSGNSCYRMLQDRDGFYWIATDTGVVRFRYDNGLRDLYYISEERGLAQNFSLRMTLDREQNLWVSTHNGLSRIFNPGVLAYDQRDGFLAKRVYQTIRTSDGDHITATERGVYILDRSDHRIKKRLFENLRVPAIAADQNGNFYVSSEHQIFKVRKNDYAVTGSFMLTDEAPIKPFVTAMIVLDGELICGSRRGLFKIVRDRVERMSVDPVLDNELVNALSVDDTTFWASTDVGAYRIAKGRVIQTIDQRTGLSVKVAGEIWRDPTGRLWIATEGGGINIYDGRRMETITVKDGLSTNIVNSIEPVNDSILWAGTSRGVDAIGIYSRKVRPFTAQDGYFNKGSAIASVDRTLPGLIWLATSTGLSRVDERYQPVLPELPIMIHQLRVNQMPFVSQSDLQLTHDQKDILIDVRALSYRYEGSVEYQFFLKGSDVMWSPWTTNHEIKYNHLEPGTYSLIVRARCGASRNEQTILTWTQLPPFWRTTWFVFIAGIGSVLLGWGLLRWRTFALYQRTRELEIKVQERTKDLARRGTELLTQKKELEQALAALREAQSRLIQAEKMSSLGQMVAGIAHEINNPLTFVLGNIGFINEELAKLDRLRARSSPLTNDEIEAFEKDTDVLLKSAREGGLRILEIVEALKKFSRLHKSQTDDIDIHECIEHAVTMVLIQFPALRVEKRFAEPFQMTCRPSDLQQAFYNILLNGVQAQKDHPQTVIETKVLEDRVLIKFIDFGAGIKPDIRHAVFDPFFTTKDVGEGKGLGLSLAYTAINDHKGKIYFESGDRGTTFFVELPAKLIGNEV